MSEQANVQLVQQIYGNIAAGDVATVLGALAADVQWVMPEIPNVPFAGSWQGREQVSQFFRRLTDAQDVVEFVPQTFIAQDDTVVVLGRFTMYVKATGRESRSEWAHAWTVKDGKITRMREYVDTAAVSRAHPPVTSVDQTGARTAAAT